MAVVKEQFEIELRMRRVRWVDAVFDPELRRRIHWYIYADSVCFVVNELDRCLLHDEWV